MRCVGIRGAITVDSNTRAQVLSRTKEVLLKLVEANDIKEEDIACAFLTTTRDVNAEFPAVAARELGWTDTALLCGHEMEVPGSLQKCIRVLLLVNTEKTSEDVTHAYLRGASVLRNDIRVSTPGVGRAGAVLTNRRIEGGNRRSTNGGTGSRPSKRIQG